MRSSLTSARARFQRWQYDGTKWLQLVPLALSLTACVEPPGDSERSADASLGNAVQAAPSLACSVRALSKQSPSSPSVLQVSLVNAGNSTVELNARNLPFAHPEREYFTVEHAGREVSFRGLQVKLLPPDPTNLVRLQPGAALQALYTLSDYYHLGEVGQYNIQTLRPSVHVLGAAGLQRVAVSCNDVTLSLEVAEPEPPPVVEPEPEQRLAAASFQGCTTTQQAAIQRAESMAKWMLPIALGSNPGGRSQIAADSKYYAEWFGAHTSTRANKAKQKLEQIAAGLGSGVNYKCHLATANQCDDAIAWVVPLLGNKVNLCESFFTQVGVGWDTKWGILVHELSHLLALTGDHEYGRTDCIDLADSDPDKAVKNADSYEYFVEDIYLGLAPRHDVTGDGRSDLVTTKSGYGFVYPGTSSRTFGSYTDSFAGTLNSALFDNVGHWILDAADMNRDGHADLVTIGSDGKLYVYFGSASGAFGSAQVSSNFDSGLNLNLVFDDGSGYEPLGVADTNGDLNPDLVAIKPGGAVCSFFGSSAGLLTPAKFCTGILINSSFMDGAGEYVIDLADVDGDRRADVITAGDSGTVRVYRGLAGGNFSAGVGSFAGSYNFALGDGTGHEPIGVADVTGDGRADLVTHYHLNNNTYVYPGQSGATFGAGVPSFGGTMVSSLFSPVIQVGHELIGVFDVDGNGLADLVTRHSGGNAYVYSGQPTGQLVLGVASFAGTLDSRRFDQLGHEFVTERRQHRRRGCAPTGCM